MLIGILIVIGLIILDQVTKYIAVTTLTLGFSNVIIPKVLTFQLIYNEGASFGMLSGEQLLFTLVTIGALLIFGYFFTEIDFKKKKVFSLAIILLLAGALGNAIDRIFVIEGVIDFIHIPIIPLFATFNFADAFMNIGIVLFIVDLIFFERKREANEEV